MFWHIMGYDEEDEENEDKKQRMAEQFVIHKLL